MGNLVPQGRTPVELSDKIDEILPYDIDAIKRQLSRKLIQIREVTTFKSFIAAFCLSTVCVCVCVYSWVTEIESLTVGYRKTRVYSW